MRLADSSTRKRHCPRTPCAAIESPALPVRRLQAQYWVGFQAPRRLLATQHDLMSAPPQRRHQLYDGTTYGGRTSLLLRIDLSTKFVEVLLPPAQGPRQPHVPIGLTSESGCRDQTARLLFLPQHHLSTAAMRRCLVHVVLCDAACTRGHSRTRTRRRLRPRTTLTRKL
ncbi:hypothetical protein BDZ89DRAFT_570812 [Hymenopellis radicata]|nr:hypothetical protein BDZ89DRAFT_570812 [Hymenopellis radicata]